MNFKTLISALTVAACAGSAAAADTNAVLIGLDGRVIKAQGVPTEMQLQRFETAPEFEPRSVPATCKAFDINKVKESEGGLAGMESLPGVPNTRFLISSWLSAGQEVGVEPDSMFYCHTTSGERVFLDGQAINRSYEYRRTEKDVPQQGQVVSYMRGDMLVGVVFWNKGKAPQSEYVSLNFGR